MKLYLHAHFDRNNVKVGDKVEQYKTKLGTIGNANSSTSFNNMYAHDHFSVSEGLSVESLYRYVYGWTLNNVKKYYLNPKKQGIDFNRVYPNIKNVDLGNRGYDYLQSIKNSKKEHIGYHPGIDINNSIGGNTDFGETIMAACNGTVIHEWRGWSSNRGFGNVIVIEEEENNCDAKEQKVEQLEKDLLIAKNELEICQK